VPVFVRLEAALQEPPVPPDVRMPELERLAPPAPPEPRAEDVDRVNAMLAEAERPLILAGRVGRGEEAWSQRIRLAERFGANVLTDLKAAGAFPTLHPLHPAAPGVFLPPDGAALIRDAAVILNLGWIDLAGPLNAARPEAPA